MKYARLVLITFAGLAVIMVSGGGVWLLQEYLRAQSYALPDGLFVGALFGVLGAAFSIASKMCLSEIRRIQSKD